MLKKSTLLGALFLLALLTLPVSAQSNRIILDNNFGTSSSLWQIQGEPTLVMNGFDLTPTSLRFPVIIENINIDIYIPKPNEIVDVVVYQDPNGGSPVDATLVAQTQTVIDRAGVFVVNFPEPVIVDAPAVWIGFYMPVGMEFRADRQGSSVLTYWAWTPQSRFNLRDLSTAQILGPSNGTSPVNINLEGVARIRAEARTADNTIAEGFYNDRETIDPSTINPLDYLINYAGCPTLFKDESDVVVSLNSSVSATCREVESWNAPRSPSGYTRRTTLRGVVYDVAFYTDGGNVITGDLDVPITHCVVPAANEREVAVIGIAYGAPRRWEFLPTEVFGNLACAEIPRGGSISYFTPDS